MGLTNQKTRKNNGLQKIRVVYYLKKKRLGQDEVCG